MADLSFRPEALPGTCSNGDPDAVCALFVNTTLYEPLILELGPAWEQYTSRGTQWFTFILSVFMSFWFVYNMFTGHCGWEVIFVTVIEFVKIVVEIFYEYDTPCMIYSVFGPVTPWLRYLEWLLTCPVILIHLSNLTGLDEEYSARTMNLLTSDQGTICFGITACFSRNGWIKVICFLTGLSFGFNTFYTASRVYIEGYHQVPKGLCKTLVKCLCGMFFCSWLLFPLMFIAGPEGTGYLSWSGSTIGHTVADLLSKNIWGLIAHYMQVKIREHILIHGDIRKTVETTVGGQTFEVEEFGTMEDAENDEGYQKVENGLDRRASFQLIGNRLKNNGQDVALAGSGDLEKNKGGPAAQDMELPAGVAMDPQQNMQMLMMMQQMMQQQQMTMPHQNSMGNDQYNAMAGQMPAQQQMTMPHQNSMGNDQYNAMAGQMTMPHQNSMGSNQQQMMAMPQQSNAMAGQMSPSGQLSPGQMSPGGPMYGQQQMNPQFNPQMLNSMTGGMPQPYNQA